MGACCAATQGIKDKKKNGQGKLEQASQDVPKIPSPEPKPQEKQIDKVDPQAKPEGADDKEKEPEIVEEIQEDLGDLEWYTRDLPNHHRSKFWNSVSY